MDLSANGGLEALMAFYMDNCSKGTSKIDQPNFGLTTGTLFAALSAQADNLRRFTPDAKMAELGFANVKVLNATIIADPSMAPGDLRLVNTNFTKLQVLRTPGQKNVGDRPQSIPVSISEFQQAYNSLHKVSLLYATLALTTSSNQRNGIATNCS